MQKSIKWREFEHQHTERSSDWFWIVGIIAIAFAVLAFYFGNILFAVIILLATFVIFLNASTPPRIINYEINPKGIYIDEAFYPFNTLESFWVIDREINDMIILKSKKIFMPYIYLDYDSAKLDPDMLRDYLLDYLDEEEMDEPVAHIIMEWFGL